jgi:hypothetical protein
VYVEKNNLIYDLPTDLYQIPQMHFSKKNPQMHICPHHKNCISLAESEKRVGRRERFGER